MNLSIPWSFPFTAVASQIPPHLTNIESMGPSVCQSHHLRQRRLQNFLDVPWWTNKLLLTAMKELQYLNIHSRAVTIYTINVLRHLRIKERFAVGSQIYFQLSISPGSPSWHRHLARKNGSIDQTNDFYATWILASGRSFSTDWPLSKLRGTRKWTSLNQHTCNTPTPLWVTKTPCYLAMWVIDQNDESDCK